MQKKLVLLCLLLSLLVSACSTAPQPTPATPAPTDPVEPINPEPEAIKEFTGQSLVWEKCDPTIYPPGGAEAFAGFGDRLECATAKTPLDWNKTELDKIDLGILRVKAADPAQRKGAILINPGGPGGDGLVFGAIIAFLMSNPQNPAAPQFQQVLNQYDLIGFSPRGLGGSSQHFCGTNKLAPFSKFYTDRSPENLQAILAGARLAADACQSNPTTKYINSEQTAWDMELIRRLLKDDKINYLGYSYGSWLGAWYAKRFPEHTGNFVLDSNADFSQVSLEKTFSIQPESFQEGFEKIVVPYLVRNNAVFALGENSEAVYGVYDTLPVEVKAVVTGPITQTLYNAAAIGDIGAYLIAAKNISAVLAASPNPLDPNVFLQQLNDLIYSPDKTLDEAARAFALELGEQVLDYLAASPQDVVLNPEDAVFVSVVCNDGDWNRDPNYWIELGNKGNQDAPLSGGSLTSSPCAYWKKASTTMPAAPSNVPPLLLVQAEFDPATNTSGALDAFATLPNAKMVFINDEKQHGVFPHGTACVDAAVAQYLSDGTMPKDRITNCSANPLPGETQVFPADGVTPQGVTQAMLKFPVKGEKTLEDTFREIIQRNAIRPFANQ
jgi:pimeloyl-ACP methyl ester carboxylesterase